MENCFKGTGGCVRLAVSVVVLMTINACSHSAFSLIGINDKVDESIPKVKNIRVLPDVSSSGFEWSLPEDTKHINGYVLYRLNSKNKWDKVSVVRSPLSTHVYDGKLKPRTRYSYSIATIGKNGKVSPRSPTITITTSYISPVDFVHASGNYPKQIKIIWSPSVNPGVRRYIVERLDKNKKFIRIGTTDDRMDIEYFDTNLDDNSTYTYRIVGQSCDGTLSLPSKAVQGSTKNRPKPVINVTATRNLLKKIQIKWDKHSSDDVVGYNVMAADSPNAGYRKVAFVKDTSYVDHINKDDKSRYYKIVAVDSTNLQSELDGAGVLGRTLGPPQPPVISQVKIKDAQVVITWQRADDERITGYMVHKTGFSKEEYRFEIDQTTFVDRKIEEGMSYVYTVTSLDKNNAESKHSNEVKISIPLSPRGSSNQGAIEDVDNSQVDGHDHSDPAGTSGSNQKIEDELEMIEKEQGDAARSKQE